MDAHHYDGHLLACSSTQRRTGAIQSVECRHQPALDPLHEHLAVHHVVICGTSDEQVQFYSPRARLKCDRALVGITIALTPVAAQGGAHAAGHFAKCFLTVQPQPVLAGRLASSEMRTSAPDLRLSSPVHALRSAVGRGLASWPIAEVLAVRWRWCSFPLATFAVCQAARQSRLAARVLAAARTTGTLKMTPRRAPGVLGLDFAGCTK